MNVLLKIWWTSLYVLLFAVITTPLCINYNMDINNVPPLVQKDVDTRFSYVDDLIEPVGIAVAIEVCAPITAPMIVYGEYMLLTNQWKYNKKGQLTE